MGKMKIAVIFGGRSGEHEVSLVSAASVIKALNPEKYQVLEIGITRDGKWYSGEKCLYGFKKGNFKGLRRVYISLDPEKTGFLYDDGTFEEAHVVFPVLHGPFGEDGTVQGLFEMMGIPYVGSGVLASSTAMDKLQCKTIWESAGLPVVPYVGFNRTAWKNEPERILAEIKKGAGIPCFVKPVNMGSSVGITKVKNEENLGKAIDLAARFDQRILVEKSVNAREIECALLGNDEVVAAPVGEVIVGGEFYDFYDKYVDGVSRTEVPADIPEPLSAKIKEICIKAYKLLDCSGFSRVDCFVDRDTEKVYLNELNTIPGFTSISMYPKMMEAHGMSYEELVDKLVQLGLERFAEKQKNQIVFDSGSDWYKIE